MFRNHVVLAAACALLCATASLTAQTTGAIEGIVTDPSGAFIPNAAVTLTNETTHVDSRTTTNAAGYFLSDGLPAGVYDIEATQPGFKEYSVKGVIVDVTARVHREITLQIGSTGESVTVQASPVQVQTADGTVSAVITREQIATAVLNGRHYARLAMLLPGATYQGGSDELSGAGLNAPDSPVSFNGINNKASGWFVDGAYDMNQGNGSSNTHVPVIDSLEEVQVQTSNYSARYGTTGGAIINAVTRSGTSAFHGAAYEYFRNNDLDARNFFSPTRTPLKQNQYGFTIGGPVFFPHYNKDHNKTFFFWSEDWRRRNSAAVNLTATPTDAMRAGDFSAEAARLGKPILDPTTKQPFPNNIIPTSRIDPNAALLLKTYFPEPNYPGSFQNYINNGVGILDPRTDTVKIDHNFTDSLRASFVWSHDNIPVLSTNGNLTGSPFPNIRQREATTGDDGNVRLNWTLSPRTTNEVSWAIKEFNVNLLLEGEDGVSPVRPAGLAIRDFYQGANKLNLIPQITFNQGWGSISTNLLPLSPAKDNNFVFADNFSHIAGSHTLQAGVSWFHYNKTQAAFNSTQGSYSFDGSFTNDPVADFLLGDARTYSESQSLYVRTYSFDQTEWYAQDDWRVTRKLTVNAGVRLFVIPMTHVDGNLMSSFVPSQYDPAKAPQISSAGILVPGANYDPLNGLVFPEKNGTPRGFVNTFVGLAPRFGFAYDPTGNGKMAIRGGYGISYLNVGTDQSGLITNPPFNQTVSLQNVSLDDPSGGTPNAPRPISLNAFDTNFKRPMVQSYSLTVQRELPGQILASAGYVGTRGTNWEVWIDRNSPNFGVTPPGYDFDPRLGQGYNQNLLRPFAGYAGITEFSSGLSSDYNSLQTTFQRRFSNGLAIQGVYTYSKTIGEEQTRRDMRVQNPLNWDADRGPVDFDRTHVFSASYIYTLPFFHGRRNLAGQALGGWELSGFLTAQSGLALTPGISLSSAGLATRPNATGAPASGPRTQSQWFNPAAFVAPALGMYGNAGVGTLRGPGFWIWDSSVSKQFPIKDQFRVRFAAEFFNFLNHTNWASVDTGLGDGT
ncbi:MAG: carboxypeptidase-like regulatory domain-containing protein [Bryobacteraceae bacterium]